MIYFLIASPFIAILIVFTIHKIGGNSKTGGGGP